MVDNHFEPNHSSAVLTKNRDGGIGSDDPSLILRPACVHTLISVLGAGDEELVILGQHIHSALTGCREVITVLVPGDDYWLGLTGGRALQFGRLASLDCDINWLFDEHWEHCKQTQKELSTGCQHLRTASIDESNTSHETTSDPKAQFKDLPAPSMNEPLSEECKNVFQTL